MLNREQVAFLRKEGQSIKPYLLGKGEVDQNFIALVDKGLEANELIKIKLLNNSALNAKEVAAEVAARLNAEVVFIVGHTALLYRHSKKGIYFK